MMIWLAAEKVYPGLKFTKYAVLGDDVIIADKAVASVYAESIRKCGVKISENKSLISSRGCAEFAKRFLVNDLTKDLSPVSCRCLLNYFHPMGLYGLARQYTFVRDSTFCRVGGLGFRGLSTFKHKRSRTVERHLWMLYKTRLPLSWWLGRGKPLNPYLTGIVVDLLRTNLKPKELKIVPDNLFRHERL